MVERVGVVLDAAGVSVIVLGAAVATWIAASRLLRRQADTYVQYRQNLGRTILLGLELLVAADIVRTVAVTPTLQSVAVLGGIVLIRTFLSYSLEVEISGRPPWGRKPAQAPEPPA